MTEQNGQNKRHRGTGGVNDVHDDDDDDVRSTSNTDPSTTSPRSNIGSPASSSSRESCKLTFDNELVERDMPIVSTYVKEELYYGVKFLYDPKKDLAFGGQIFNHFYKTCGNKLEGVKKYQKRDEKELYLHCL